MPKKIRKKLNNIAAAVEKKTQMYVRRYMVNPLKHQPSFFQINYKKKKKKNGSLQFMEPPTPIT